MLFSFNISLIDLRKGYYIICRVSRRRKQISSNQKRIHNFREQIWNISIWSFVLHILLIVNHIFKNLQFAVPPLVQPKEPVIKGSVGSMVRLVCTAESWPRPDVTWEKDGNPLFDSNHYAMVRKVFIWTNEVWTKRKLKISHSTGFWNIA